MKLLSMALLVGASLVSFNSYSQISIHIGRRVPPPPVVVYESRRPAPCPVYRGREKVVVVEQRRGYDGYSRREDDQHYQHERFEDRRRNDSRRDDYSYQTKRY